MSEIVDQVIAANEKYASVFGTKKDLALPPARRFAILTCMDARLDPAKYAGLAEGDAHVIRNAGGRATEDAIRSLVISHKLLGTQEWFVIHHTNCGMELFTDGVSPRGRVVPGTNVLSPRDHCAHWMFVPVVTIDCEPRFPIDSATSYEESRSPRPVQISGTGSPAHPSLGRE